MAARWQATAMARARAARTVGKDRERRTLASARREKETRPRWDTGTGTARVYTHEGILAPTQHSRDACWYLYVDYSRLCVFLRGVVDGRARRVSLGFGRRLQSSRRRVFEPGLRRATSRRDGARTSEPRVSNFFPPRHVAHVARVVSASPRHVPRSVQSSSLLAARLWLWRVSRRGVQSGRSPGVSPPRRTTPSPTISPSPPLVPSLRRCSRRTPRRRRAGIRRRPRARICTALSVFACARASQLSRQNSRRMSS